MSTRKKLIEVALPLEAINEASAREKSIRHGHPSTLHLWWARRPLAAARAVIFASLVDDPGDPDLTEGAAPPPPEYVEACRALPRGKNATVKDTPRMRLFDFIETLVLWESTTDEDVLNTARELIRLSTGGNPPPLLDPFAGGGSIPLEAQRLGLEAHASDLNPVAVMINKALIEIPPLFAGRPPVNRRDRGGIQKGMSWKGAAGLAADVRYYGEWMRERAWERIGHLYPKGPNEETVIAWLWARTVSCPNPACGAQMPLVRSFELSKKKGKEAWVEPVIDHASKRVRFTVRTGRGKAPEGTVVRTGARCIVCGTPVPFDHVRAEGKAGRMSARLMAIVTEGKSGRNYHAPDEYHVRVAEQAQPTWRPDHPLPHNPRDFKTPNYGMRTFADLFTPRQLVALTTFSDLVGEARAVIQRDAVAAGLPDDDVPLREGGTGARAYAEAVSVYLAFAVDKGTDYWSVLCSWHNSRELIRNTFGRQALPMIWDFADTNPFSISTGNWMACVDWVWKSIETTPATSDGSARQQDAAQIRGEASIAISTDPPYCLAPGTLIMTAQGYRPIEDIRPGDAVLTHRGRFARVTRVYRRAYEGPITRLKVAHVSQPLLITGEHPLYGIRTGGCAVGYADYCRADCPWEKQNSGCHQQVYNEYQLDWIPAVEARRHDLIFMPSYQETLLPEAFDLTDYLPESAYISEGGTLHYQKATAVSLQRTTARQYQIPAVVPLTADLCWLLGYFVADGYAHVEHDGGTIQFTAHVDESDLHETATRLMARCFGLRPGKATDNRSRNNQSVRLNFYSKPVAELLRAWCYTDDGHKQFPDWAVSLPDDEAVAMLAGYWAGDGYRSNRNYSASTNSPCLAGQIRLILQRLGLVSRLHIHDIKATRINDDWVYPTGPQYLILVNGKSLLKLAELIGLPDKGALSQQRGGQHGHWWPGGYLLPIRDAATEPYNGDVYNLETEDHSYTTAAGCVHNCDNIGYADLSDFFYVWMRRNLQDIYPDLFSTMVVPKAEELVATPYRFEGGKVEARIFFEEGLHGFFRNARHTHDAAYPFTVFYAFKQAEQDKSESYSHPLIASTGWETVLQSLDTAGFAIVGTWPMRTELLNRPVASGTNALASSIVLVCRPRPEDAPVVSRREFSAALRRELPAALEQLQSGNIAPVDLAQAAIGPGMAVYSRYRRVLEANGEPLTVRTALQLINAELDAYLAEAEGGADADTRFAVAWFEQHAFEEGPYGQAEVLVTARNTSVDGLVQAGIVEAGGGKVRLLRPHELDPAWDPTTDKRPTVWEATHHLLERLDTHGESGAAALLLRMSADLAADARHLAYRLYNICERKGRAELARGYNALIISWPGVAEQAAEVREQRRTGGVQMDMFDDLASF